MKNYTLGFLFRNGKIILAKKKRKIGVDKWNGYGGRMEEGEEKLECLVREIREECGAIVEKGDCKELGEMEFYFEGKSELDNRVFIYRVDKFSGEPKETKEEMGEPKEFSMDEIPYSEMMVGDDKFMPLFLEGKKFKGKIHFSENGEELIESVVNEVVDEKRNEMKLR
jgi:8-oxo-dGTP diphosphatase